MIKIISGKNQSGRTTRLVEYAIENNLVLVTLSPHHCDYIRDIRNNLLSSGKSVNVPELNIDEMTHIGKYSNYFRDDGLFPLIITRSNLIRALDADNLNVVYLLQYVGIAIDDFDMSAESYFDCPGWSKLLCLSAITVVDYALYTDEKK
jgi:hypothetical protein